MDEGSPFTIFEEFAFSPGDKLTGVYPAFEYATQSLVSGPDYRVVPFVGDGAGREYGVESNYFRTTHSESNWPTYRANNYRDGQASVAGPAQIGETWQVELVGNALMSEPVIGYDGTIFVSTLGEDSWVLGGSAGHGYLYAVHPGGQLWWRYKCLRGVFTSPAAVRCGRVVTADVGGMVYCLAPDGKQLWRTELAGITYFSCPLVDSPGNVFIITHTYSGGQISSSTLYKLLPDGAIDWSRPLNDRAVGSPFYNAAGQVTIIDSGGELYSYDYSGTLVENFMLPNSPAESNFCAGGTFRGSVSVYGSDDNRLNMVAADNSQQLDADLGEEPFTLPAFGSASTVMIGTRTTGANPVLKLNRYITLSEDWDMDVNGNTMSNIAVDSSDRAFFGSFNFVAGITFTPGGIYCVLPDQTTAWEYQTDGTVVPLSAVIADDNLLVCLLSEAWESGNRSVLLGIRGD